MQLGGLFAEIIGADKPLLYVAEIDTQITNIALDTSSSSSKASTSSTANQPVLVKIQFEAQKANDESDEEDQEDSDDEEALTEMKEIVVCSLIPGQIMQAQVNIFLREDDHYRFVVSGGTHDVHLLGHYVFQPSMDETPYNSDDDSDEDEDEESDEEESGRIHEIEDDADAEAEAEALEVLAEEKKAAEKQAASKKGSKKRQAEDDGDEDEEGDAAGDVSMANSTDETAKLSKSQRKKLAKKLKAGSGEAAAPPASAPPAETKKSKPAAEKPASAPPAGSKSTVTLTGGLKYTESKEGSGPSAKAGQYASMRYIGKFANGKVFDQNTKGKPFKFKLGAGEVIKGWDVGVIGMKVGAERKLVVPAALAYGKRGAPPTIPPNANLTFDVKLLKID